MLVMILPLVVVPMLTLGLLLGMAMVCNMLVATIAGTLVPLGLKALRVDPALGFVECGYCDRRFVLIGGPADSQAA